jgi:threonine aldolase
VVANTPDDYYPDKYGSGKVIEEFEQQLAELLGKEASLFFVSGTMAQQIALRIWCDQMNKKTVLMHPTAHPEFAEHLAYQYIMDLKRTQFGAPEFVGNRLLKREDFDKVAEEPGVVLFEIPQRVIGYQVPDWDALLQQINWAKEKKIPVHLDGARIWEVLPYYNKELTEICAQFDSVYVSFYKGLGGICGAGLAGSKEFIEKAKVWQRRLGGNLVSQFPLILSDKLQLDKRLPKMGQYFEYAKSMATIFRGHSDLFRVMPEIPQSNSFALFIEGETEKIKSIHEKFAKEHKVWLINGPGSTEIPGINKTEIVIGDNALFLPLNKWKEYITIFSNMLRESPNSE